MRVEERILSLTDTLPTFLVKNRKMYAILSKGVHELDEDECLKMLSALTSGIALILQQDLEEINKLEREQELAKALSRLTNSSGNDRRP
jgi:hypothetical protein